MIVYSSSSVFFFSSRRRHTRSYGDWSSDVCSSDLHPIVRVGLVRPPVHRVVGQEGRVLPLPERGHPLERHVEIGRASCRERVWVAVGAGAVRRKGGDGGELVRGVSDVVGGDGGRVM